MAEPPAPAVNTGYAEAPCLSDHYSRYPLACEGLERTKTTPVKAVFEAEFILDLSRQGASVLLADQQLDVGRGDMPVVAEAVCEMYWTVLNDALTTLLADPSER